MANYLLKYKGQYRLKCPIDESTNDFPKTLNGLNEDIDVYIKCFKGKIFHYGHGVLQAYIPKLGVGRNIIRAIGKDLGFDFAEDASRYDQLCKEILATNIIFDIEETDEEVLFKFKAKNLENIICHMQPQTSGAKTGVFSPKNLPKAKYEIPTKDLKEYEAIICKTNNDYLFIARITNNFIKDIPNNYKKFKNKNIKELQRKSCLKGKEFIHSIGLWTDYIKYLRKELNND